MLLDISDTLQISTHVLTGRVAGLSRKSKMDICLNPTGSGVNHVAINLTLFLCAYYNVDMLPTYPYATCRLNIVSTSTDTNFGRVTDMSAKISATCWADTHVLSIQPFFGHSKIQHSQLRIPPPRFFLGLIHSGGFRFSALSH